MIRLTKECENAANICKNAMLSSNAVTHPSFHITEEKLKTGFFVFCQSQITLFCGDTWRWSKGGMVSDLWISPYAKITLYKLNSRSKEAGKPSCRAKVWVHKIQMRNQNKVTHLVWCERGIECNTTHPEREELKLEDFAFLKPFVTPEVAKELNWV